MASITTIQLNVRMPATLRENGDQALESKGYTPAQFVRKAWERLAKRGPDLEAMIQAIETDAPATTDTAASFAPASPATATDVKVCRAPELWQELMRNTNLIAIEEPDQYARTSFDEMLEHARAEQFGAIHV